MVADLLNFLDASPTPWHAVLNCKERLQGFTPLQEREEWTLEKGARYLVDRGGSSLAAFILPKNKINKIKIIAAHTDSPTFKLKPNATYMKDNLVMVGLEPYGSPLVNSWLNRDLGIAGRIFYLDEKDQLQESLVNLDYAPLTIPQLAIHLDRDINEKGLLLNQQDHLPAVAGFGDVNFLEKNLKRTLSFKRLLSHDLFLYPLERARQFGELLTSFRLDNLASCFAALQALLSQEADDSTLKMIALWDHEEIGSKTAHGAGSPFILHLLERLVGRESLLRLLPESMTLSVDLAHALNPNYASKYEPHHPLLLGKGVVLKHHASGAYATEGKLAASLEALAIGCNVPIQKFVSRSDMRSGSTIGPIHATATGMPTVDIGIPELSMHSARELIAVPDLVALTKLLTQALQL